MDGPRDAVLLLLLLVRAEGANFAGRRVRHLPLLATPSTYRRRSWPEIYGALHHKTIWSNFLTYNAGERDFKGAMGNLVISFGLKYALCYVEADFF